MDSKIQIQKQKFSDWAKENLGEQTGKWYSPYIEKLGKLLNDFELNKGNKYHENFFLYESFDEFKEVYKEIIGQTDDEIEEILKGKRLRYPNSYAEQKIQWNKKYAKMTYDEGERNSPDNYGGIADIGALFRSYLKFLYYKENPSLIYPKKEKKTQTNNGEIEDSINYWLYTPGDNASSWNEFYKNNVMGLGWDFLGNLEKYKSYIEIEKAITENRKDGIRPINDTKAVWDFYKEVKPGDIVYAKDGVKKIVGRGVVKGEYYFDNDSSKYKHRHDIVWTNKGNWNLNKKVDIKALTNINGKSDLIVYFDSLIDKDITDEKENLINEFKTWLSNQVQSNGESLDDKTITSKVSSLKDIEKNFEVTIFGETDTDILKNIKNTAIDDKSYNRYKGVYSSAIDYYIRYVESRPIIEENVSYSLDDFLSEVFMNKEKVFSLQSILQNKKNLILKGAPGVGKTFIADRLAYLMMEEKDDNRIQMIQFHQSYSYEDFIEGYRPKSDGDGFELKQGPFVKFARKAARDIDRDYFFIIDEINRGNMSKIFGELMMLIESDKRGKSINLLYSNEKFYVPYNLYIIGMMNTADRSLALLDYALRRRFSFFDISPAFDNSTFIEYIEKIEHSKKLSNIINQIKELNNEISKELGTGFQIGHSYFVGEAFEVDADKRIAEVVEFEIIPQLYEYWFDNESKAKEWADRLRGAYNDN